MGWWNKILFLLSFNSILLAQDNLENLLNPINEDEFVSSTFMSTRIINSHSVEMFGAGSLDVRISHRFGTLSTGIYEIFGLDQATIRIGLEYGISKKTMIGFGRSSYKKNYDGFVKYSIIKQSKHQNIPLSLVYFGSMTLETLKKNQENYPISGRIGYCNQLLIASKLNNKFSVQITPTFVHKNMVESPDFFNDVFLLGSAIKIQITKRVSLNLEHYNRITNKNETSNYNPFSIGFDIETGGHVFQMHVTNSVPMYELGFLTETNESWSDGGIHFGFNISREFTLK